VHFEDAWNPPLDDIGFVCETLMNLRGQEQAEFLLTIGAVLQFIGVDRSTADDVINCLKRVLSLTP
jgi:hypothetical protein